MANTDIHVPIANFPTHRPNSKTWRLLYDKYPQIQTRVESPDESFRWRGTVYGAGYLVQTNVASDPDAAAIAADMVLFADGTTDPVQSGVAVPTFANAAALPAQPPDLPTNFGYLAIVEAPTLRLYTYHGGTWHQGPNL